jgi:integrase
MPKAHLSAAIVATTQCPPGKTKLDLYCSQVTGFVFERRSSGGGTYYFRFTDAAGRQAQFKIGGEGDITFAAAKRRAIQLRSEVVMGGDPRTKKAEAKATALFREIAADHIAYAQIHLRAHDSVEMIHRLHLLPRFGKMRVTDITSLIVAQWLAEKRAAGLAPGTIEKLRVTMSRSYELASQAGVHGCDKNPARGFPRKPLNNARNVYLSKEEAARLRVAVADSQNIQLQYIVGLLLFTGARKRELLDSRWENVNIDRRTWFIPTSKSGKSRHVPLSTAALAIIEALPRFKDCPWLVPNPATGLPFVSVKSAWSRAIRVAKLPGLRIHDLRHSAASFMVNSGVDLFAVGRVLGHANVASSARYAHLSNDTLLAAVEAGAAKQAG